MNADELRALADELRKTMGVIARETEVYTVPSWLWDELAKAAAALRACADRLEADGWQDIASAPRDGTRVLVWWQDEGWGCGPRQIEAWYGPRGAYRGDDCWQTVYDWQQDDDDGPTHWRPRPEPPKDAT